MKKFYSLLVAAAMVLGATSCQKDAAETVATNEPVSFTATLNATRTELGEGNKVMWNAGDKIAIYTRENTAGVVFDGDATEATATATFTTTSEFAASETGYLAVYPELKWNTPTYPPTGVVPAASYADGIWSVPVHIGVEQDVVTDGWDEKYNYMVAYSQDNKLAFQAATALIKFTYTGMQDGIVTLTAEGANLAGNATLNYNTADGSISYTTTGTTTEISLFGCVAGETYFIPIFPGKVTSFAVTGYSATYAPETYIGYEGEFEFKAGKIYKAAASDEPVVTPSPWTMIDPNMGTNVSMTIDDNGYHVAKAVPAGNFVFYKWTDGVGEEYLSASKELGLNEWQATATDMQIAISIPGANMFDVYLAADASMFCLVETGATVPAMPEPQYHIYVYNSANWNPLNLYVWDAAETFINGAWPGTALTTTKWVGEHEYYVYDIPTEYNGQTINFIINNASAQTGDLSMVAEGDVYYYTNGMVVEDPENPVVIASHKVYVKNSAGWSDMYIYGWNGLGTGSWPGTKMGTEDINGTTYYVYEFTSMGDITGGSLIFNNGASSQTGDITGVNLTEDLFYEVSGTGTNYKQITDPRQ